MNGIDEPDKPGELPLAASGADRPSGAAPAPSFLPPDASETGDGFLERLAPSLRPSAPANQSVPARSGPPPLPAARAKAQQQSSLETPLSSQSGLISAILTKDVRNDSSDDGALAALRTLPFRMRKSDTAAALRSPAHSAARSQTRAELLLHLAEQSSGPQKARLLTAAAELLAKRGQIQPDTDGIAERARATYSASQAADPSELVSLRKQQAAALRARQLDRARALYAAETQLPVSPAELALAHCALAEIDAARAADESAILASLKAATDALPGSLLANLLRARIELAAGRRREAAQSLARAAESRAEQQVRALLFMESGRAYERAGDPAAALGAYAQALAAEPKLFGAALGRYRAQRASGAPGAAVAALETLEQAAPDARLRSELARKRGRLLREVMGNARAALEALAETSSLPGLREKLRAAEAAGATSQLTAAIEAWAQAASGSERALALVELALAQARAGAAEAPETLQKAAIARAPQGLVAMAREILLQRKSSRPPTGSAPPRAEPSNDPAEALRAAARLARAPEAGAERDPEAVAHERAALGAIAPTEPEHALAEVIGFDAAAELADAAALQAALARELERANPAQRHGPALALLSLLSPGSEQARKLEDELHAAVRGEPLIGRFIAQRRPPAEAAALWLEEAESSSGEQAAFAAVMAGHQLHAAGQDSVDAYAEALDHVRGYPPACFALELPARQKAELAVLERVHRELATTTASRSERAGRRARLGLLSADSDLSHAVAWFELAAEDRPDDPLIAELLLRLSSEGSLRGYTERLTQTALLESSPEFARAYRLRAAAALEAGDQWNDAATLYRAILDDAPDDVFVQRGLSHVLRQGQQWDALAAQLERRFQHSERASAPSGLLEEWAEVELRRGDTQRAKQVYETLLEQRPSSLFALRGLARMAMSERDDARLLKLSEASLRAIERPAERAAELRLCVRLLGWLGLPGGDQLLLANEDRVESPLWYALMLEAVAIDRGDLNHYYQLTHQIAGLLSEPIERAAYALRAAETLEANAPSRALADLESLLLAAPGHPLALPTLARLHRAASSPRAAAEAFVHAAEQAREPERRAELFYAAGVLFEDELRDEARAAAALSRVAEIDAGYADTFSRLRRLLRARGETGALLALLEQRARSPLDAAQVAELELERAALLRGAGDRSAAMSALRNALAQDPARADALRALADLLWDEGEHHKAAEALVQLARLTDDKAALAEVVFQLGSLYDEHLRDPKRAELAFTRAATLAPDDPRPIERLVLLWKRTDQKDRAVRALQHLIASSWSVSTKESYILDLATTLEEMGERALAEQALEDARRQAPTSMRVLRAQAALYERQDDRTALSLHLQRSCNALRSAIDEEPGEPSHWLNLIELLEKRGRPDGAELVVDAAYSCGVSLPERPRPKLQGLGNAALTESVLRKLVTRGLLDPLRRLFREFHPELSEFLPAFSETTGPLAESQTRAVRAVSELFGLSELQLLGSDEPVCVPVAADPLTLCMGSDLFLSANEAERFFLLTRAVVVAKHGLMLLVRAAPERVLLVLHALRTVVRGSAVQVANEREQRSVTRELAKLLPPPRRTQLRPLLSDLLATEDVSTRRLAAAAFEFGARVALTISGNLPAALEALLRLRGKPPEELDREERLRLLRADGALRAMLSFAISEAYLEARREVLMPAAKVSS